MVGGKDFATRVGKEAQTDHLNVLGVQTGSRQNFGNFRAGVSTQNDRLIVNKYGGKQRSSQGITTAG